jgi:hypothetical protein
MLLKQIGITTTIINLFFRDPVNVNKFYFTGYFSVGAFKVLEKLGEWHPQWGLNGTVVAASNPDGS